MAPNTPKNSTAPCGIIVVDKPPGITSHDVVYRIRRIFQTKKVGHTGTLDPLATGVLVLCLGHATRIVEFLTSDSKEYIAGVRFGITTDSQDITGQVVETRDASSLMEAQIESVLDLFRGPTKQTPPMVSAIHHEGKRLYELAREGKEVDRVARPITFYEVTLLDFAPGDTPEATFRVRCSAGAYIRTLAHDIGQALSVGATMISLRRTAAGQFILSQAATLESLEELREAGHERDQLISIPTALANWPVVTLTDEEEALIQRGMKIPAPETECPSDRYLLVNSRGEESALANCVGSDLAPFKVFPIAGEG